MDTPGKESLDTSENQSVTEEIPAEVPVQPEPPREAESFAELVSDSALLEKITAAGFTKPTSVQARSIPLLTKGLDVIMQAQTGSGKTLAYVLPLLGKLADAPHNPKAPFALAVVPTRELALQVKSVLNSLQDAVKPACLIGGADWDAQAKELAADSRFVIGTPGRLLDFIRKQQLKLNRCRYFVLDEADEMLSTGFLEDVRTILSRLPDERQGIFVSATITPRVDMLANSFLTKPEVVRVADESSAPAITHSYFDVGGDLMAKPNALCDIIEVYRPSSAIIFCNTRSDTQLVEVRLRRRGFDARRLNSDLTQSQRNKVMQKIRAKELRFLVATDIAARGIDIEELEMVINYSIHEQPEIYVHRTGRTGRAGKQGRALSLVGPRDFSSFHFLTKVLETQFVKLSLPTDEEVADARLTHLYEIIRENHIEAGPRDLITAKKLLKEIGGIDESPEDFTEIMAKLSRFIVEHYISQEAKALDEEIAPAEPAPEQGEEERYDHGRGRDRGRGGDRRDDRRGRDRRDDRRADRRDERPEERREDRRDERRDDRRDRRRDEGDYRARQQQPQREQRSEEAAEAPKPQPEEAQQAQESAAAEETPAMPRELPPEVMGSPSEPNLVRLYIGQGIAQGMTPEVFTSLAVEFGEVKNEDLKYLVIREHYGFADLTQAQAYSVIENLNGIEYNGTLLPVEFATALSQPRPRRDYPPRQDRYNRDDRYSRDRNDRYSRGRDDNYGNRGGGGRGDWDRNRGRGGRGGRGGGGGRGGHGGGRRNWDR